MLRAKQILILLAVAGLGTGGCTSLRWINRPDVEPMDVLQPDQEQVEPDGQSQVEAATGEPTPVNPPLPSSGPDQAEELADQAPPGSQRLVAASERVLPDGQRQAATEAELLERLEALEGVDAQQYAALKEALEQPDPALPPLYRQQLLAMAEYLERQADPGGPAVAETQPAGAAEATPDRPEPLVSRDSAIETIPHHSSMPQEQSLEQPAGAAAGGSAADEGQQPEVVPIGAVQTVAAEVAAEPAGIEPPAQSWKQRLDQTIRSLQAELERDGEPEERARLETSLRLLHAIADQREQSLQPVQALGPAEQEFWKHQLHGLLVCLDAQAMPVASRRSALALRHLREANRQLTTISTLDVRNLAFCTRVDGFGRYTEFPKYQFRPDQEVLLYVEVDNFTVEQNGAEFETELQGSYQILDAEGRRLADHLLPQDKQTCRNPRRDYFIAYRLYLPKVIPSGSFTLQLSIEDVKGQKFGQGTVDFTVK